jgi:DNA-binding transcriptional MerR regulator
MAYKEKEIEKLYYSIGETAELLGLSTSVLRFWEKEFDTLKPKKNGKGDRFFTKDDIEQIKLIRHLVREKGFTIEGAKAQLKHKPDETQKKFKVIEKLQKVRGFLNSLKDEL